MKVTVIVPCFNAETTLQKCLSSIQRQTHSNIEVIVIDDSSTDQSRGAFEMFESDLRFKLYVNKINKGVSASRNLGISY